MMRTWIATVGLAVCGLLVAGCGQSAGTKGSADEVKKDINKIKEVAKEAADAAKAKVVKPIEEALPKIEEKIKGLSGETATKAKESFEALKKHLEDFKTAAPDKWESLKEGMLKEFDELKKLVGLN
jgi:gas vesicle protein